MFVKKDVYNQKGCLSQQVRKNTYIAGHSSGMRIYLSSSVIIKPCEADINVKLKEQSSDCLCVSDFHQVYLLLP